MPNVFQALLLAAIRLQQAQAYLVGQLGGHRNNLGGAYYMLGGYDAAIRTLEKAQARDENAIQVKLFLAASYVKAGRQNDAEWVADQLQMLSPSATIASLEKATPFLNPEYKRIFLDELRKAGLPE